MHYHLTGEIHFLLPHLGHFTSVGKSPFFFAKCSPQSWQMYGMGVPSCGGTMELLEFGNMGELLDFYNNESQSKKSATFSRPHATPLRGAATTLPITSPMLSSFED